MQATQRGTASESGTCLGKFAALRHVMREMGRSSGAMVSSPRPDLPGEAVTSIAGVAEGAGLAHDAGNLLGALSLYSDLLAMPGVLHEEHRGYAAELRILSDRSWAMINRLVNHSRSELPVKTHSEISVLPDVADRCRGLLSRVAGRTVEISYGVGAFQPVRVPVEAVERILTNLVKNAAEATPWVGPILIHVTGVVDRSKCHGDAVRQRVVMTVSDRGCGMDALAVRRLMEVGGAASANGRGLGFCVVRELVAMSGGCLTVKSQVGVGTTICAEWYAVARTEGELRRDEARGLRRR